MLLQNTVTFWQTNMAQLVGHFTNVRKSNLSHNKLPIIIFFFF